MRNRAVLAFAAVVAAVLVAIPFPVSAKEPVSFETPKVSSAKWDRDPLKESPEVITETPEKKIMAELPGWRLYLQTNEKLELVCWKYKYHKKAPTNTAAAPQQPAPQQPAPQKCIACHGGFGGGDSGGGGSGDSGNPGGADSSGSGGSGDSGNPGGADSAGNPDTGGSRTGSTSGSNGTGDGVKSAASGASGVLVSIREVDDLPDEDSPWIFEEKTVLPQADVWDISVKKETKPFIFLKAVRRFNPNDIRDPADPDPAKRPPLVSLLLRKVANAKKKDDSKTSKR